MKKVLVLGGGFAGLETAIFLRKEGFEVTLISNRDFLFIYPISIWIPTGALPPEDARLSLHDAARAHGFEVVVSPVTAIDTENRRVTTEVGVHEGDYVVVAFGASKLKPKGFEHTLSTCGAPHDSVVFRDRLQALIARADEAKSGGSDERFSIAFGFGGNPKDKSAVRGGPMFELLFNIRHQLEQKGLLDRFDLAFYAPMPKPGMKMGEKALSTLDSWFQKMDIPKHVGVKITHFSDQAVHFADGSDLKADLLLYIPANTGHPLVEAAGLPMNDAGFVRVDRHCRVEGVDGFYAAGDVAALEGPAWKAKQGHVAEVMGRTVAHNIAVAEKGQGELHSYVEHLNILCVMDTGDGAAFVYRDEKREMLVPMPVVGHWLKQGWGTYWKWSKLGRIPRLPGM